MGRARLAPPPSPVSRAAVYLRVSTGRQAEHDLSLPDQRRQLEAYCAGKGWKVATEFLESGNTATDDKRPAFREMIEAATTKPAPFDVILVHSFSRFFRDQFEFEFYVRKLAKNGVKVVSITQELGDDPMSNMMRKIMTLFDEYQSKENGKHTLRAMKENARQGFWNGSRPPLGYRVVVAEQRGAKLKKKLEIDPVQAQKVRDIYKLALFGVNGSGPMGLKSRHSPQRQQRPHQGRRPVRHRRGPQGAHADDLQGRAPLQLHRPQEPRAQARRGARGGQDPGHRHRGGVAGGAGPLEAP